MKYDFDEERRLFQSERRGVMDLDIRSLMLYDAEDNLSNYLLVNIDNTERNNALSKVHDFENFFSIISDYSKVGYAKINLLDLDRKAMAARLGRQAGGGNVADLLETADYPVPDGWREAIGPYAEEGSTRSVADIKNGRLYLSSTVPAKSIPGTSGHWRTILPLPVMASPSL